MGSLALKARIPRFLALLYPTEEMLVGIVQIPEGGLQGRGIHFPEPDCFFLLFQHGHILCAGIVVQRFARLLIAFLSLCEIVVEYKSAATEGTGY